MFIAVEGIDGAGKTTLSKMLARELDLKYTSQKALSTYMCIPNDQYLSYCHNYRTAVNADADSMLMLYSLSCFLSGREENIVCDRHLATVYFWYGNQTTLFVPETIYKLTKKPDITIVLNVSIDTAIERTKKKLKDNIIDKFEADRDFKKAKEANKFVQNIIPFLQHFNLPYIIIDADEKSADEILHEVLLHINLAKRSTECHSQRE